MTLRKAAEIGEAEDCLLAIARDVLANSKANK